MSNHFKSRCLRHGATQLSHISLPERRRFIWAVCMGIPIGPSLTAIGWRIPAVISPEEIYGQAWIVDSPQKSGLRLNTFVNYKTTSVDFAYVLLFITASSTKPACFRIIFLVWGASSFTPLGKSHCANSPAAALCKCNWIGRSKRAICWRNLPSNWPSTSTGFVRVANFLSFRLCALMCAGLLHFPKAYAIHLTKRTETKQFCHLKLADL